MSFSHLLHVMDCFVMAPPLNRSCVAVLVSTGEQEALREWVVMVDDAAKRGGRGISIFFRQPARKVMHVCVLGGTRPYFSSATPYESLFPTFDVDDRISPHGTHTLSHPSTGSNCTSSTGIMLRNTATSS